MASKGRWTDLCGTFFVNRTCLANTCSAILTTDTVKRDEKCYEKRWPQVGVTLKQQFPLIPLLFSWDDHVNLRGEKGFQTDSCPNYPPPPVGVTLKQQFPLIPLLFSWDDHVNLRGERDFRQILAQTTPPPHNVHINKNININNIGICLKVEFSSQKSEMLKFIVLDDQHCLNDILLKPASEQN